MGIEPIRIGLSTQGEFNSRSTVEYCYFTQCNGDGEIISNKAGQNVFRYNTFEDNPKAELVLRHGSEAVVYGNFFLNNMGGVRVREGQNHRIYNNYFSGLSSRAIYLQNEDSDPLDSISILYNTIVNSAAVRLGGTGADRPTNVTFANNIFTQPDNNLFSDPTGTEEWIGNIGFGSLGIPRPAGIADVDPRLVENGEGYVGLSSGSPAINAAQAGYPAIPTYPGLDFDNEIALDLMKQQRPAAISDKDLGCSEYPHDVMIRPHATEDNTGPSYLWKGQTMNLRINIQGEGTVVLDPPYGIYDPGTEVTLTAIPSSGFAFDFWGGDLSGNMNPATIIMDEDKEVTASFSRIITDLVHLSDPTESTIRVFPNPVDHEIKMVLNAERPSFIDLELIDLSGNSVQSLQGRSIPEGEHVVSERIADLPIGVYMLHINVIDEARHLEETKVFRICKD